MIDLQEAWGHDAYPDYHTRFLEIMSSRPDPWGTEREAALSYDPVVGSTPEGGFEGWEAHWNNTFAWDMIQHHWHDYYSIPRD